MRKVAHSIILLAWLIYISSMFLPVDDKGDWNGILTTLFSIYSIKTIPVMFFSIFDKEGRGLGIALSLMGLYGICNVIFMLSICCLRSRSKFVMQTYKGVLIGASIIACSGLLWSVSSNQQKSEYTGIGVYVWPLAFLLLVLGTYQSERDKLRKDELVDDKIENSR